MSSVFTKIIQGELPGHFVWKDDETVAFLSINPLRPGHTLVVPRVEVDHWLDADSGLRDKLMETAHAIGQAQMKAFRPVKVALLVVGLEVPHLHVHLVPIEEEGQLDFANAPPMPPKEELEEAAERIRDALRELGYENAV